MKTSRAPLILLVLIAILAGGAFFVYQKSRPHSVALTWQPVSGAASYNVYRSEPGGVYKQIGSTQTPKYVDERLPRGTTYLYAVKAVVNGQESEFSNEVMAATPK